MIPKFLVIGASGYLGSAFLREARRLHPDALGLTRRAVPLESPDLFISGVKTMGYHWGVIAAAVPGLARCETDPEGTRRCNVEGTLSLARQLVKIGIRPLWFSSDQVFDGTAQFYTDYSPTCPINEYGRQKAEVEARFAEASAGTGLVVRLSKVYDATPGSGTLLDGMVMNLRSGGTERAASDLVFCPTHRDDVVTCVIRLMQLDASGIANVAAPPISRLDLARLAAKTLGADPGQVEPIRLSDLNEPFSRPDQVTLLPSKKLCGYEFQTVHEFLERQTETAPETRSAL
jgi:dTDP-4-dehydrorhamnose reductase